MAVVLAWNALPNAHRWEQGYSQIAEGDSEDKILEILGKPPEIKDCDQLRYSRPELWQKCAEEYWYVAFMQEWCYVIDHRTIPSRSIFTAGPGTSTTLYPFGSEQSTVFETLSVKAIDLPTDKPAIRDRIKAVMPALICFPDSENFQYAIRVRHCAI
jgi:hypothetical protein